MNVSGAYLAIFLAKIAKFCNLKTYFPTDSGFEILISHLEEFIGFYETVFKEKDVSSNGSGLSLLSSVRELVEFLKTNP